MNEKKRLKEVFEDTLEVIKTLDNISYTSKHDMGEILPKISKNIKKIYKLLILIVYQQLLSLVSWVKHVY